MGAAVERSQKPADKARALRFDPKTRPLDGALPWMKLKNRDPKRFYLYAPERGVVPGEFDVEYYLSLAENVGVLPDDGYVVEVRRDGGPEPAAGVTSKKGEPVRFRGNILLSCPAEFKRLLDQVGDDGASGQGGADYMDKLYRKRGAYADTRRIRTTEGISLERDPRGSSSDSDLEERTERRDGEEN